MLPLRFPNSGIRAKGRPTMARRLAGAIGHDQAPCRGRRLRPRPLTGDSRLQRATGPPTANGSYRKGQLPVGKAVGPPVGRLQGAAPVARATASRGCRSRAATSAHRQGQPPPT
ncbi:hypothetical protein GW17_00013095 [Ensete ventricosum]|nr:hypothetical protein GW17_00013095 [Ensete ventricosum]